MNPFHRCGALADVNWLHSQHGCKRRFRFDLKHFFMNLLIASRFQSGCDEPAQARNMCPKCLFMARQHHLLAPWWIAPNHVKFRNGFLTGSFFCFCFLVRWIEVPLSLASTSTAVVFCRHKKQDQTGFDIQLSSAKTSNTVFTLSNLGSNKVLPSSGWQWNYTQSECGTK